jgi:hypothetical protein
MPRISHGLIPSLECLARAREGGFAERTPLWCYILAESANRLSSDTDLVGSTIIAEALIGLIRDSKDLILRKQNWKPVLSNTPDRLRYALCSDQAGVL